MHYLAPNPLLTSSSDDNAVNIILSHHFNTYVLREISLQKKINSLTSHLNILPFAIAFARENSSTTAQKFTR